MENEKTPDLEADLAREVETIVQGMNDEKWQETRDKIRALVVKARNRRHAATGEPVGPQTLPMTWRDEPVDPSIETMNDCAVALGAGQRIAIIRFGQLLEPETALRLAAWIVAISGDEERFRKILRAVSST